MVKVSSSALPDSLRRRWRLTVAAWVLVWAGGYWQLNGHWPYAGRWALLSAPFLLYGLWVVWRHLPQNHRPEQTRLLPTLGWGNILSIGRGLAMALVAGFLLSPWPGGVLAWAPMLLYTAADVADFLDGYVARKTDHITALGAALDGEFDGLGVLIVSLLAVWYGQLPWWYLSFGLIRYVYVAGLRWRRRRGLPIYDLPPSAHRRIIAGFHMGFMSAVLWPILPPAGATIAGAIFGGASAMGFLRDWLVVSGRVDPEASGYRRWMGRLGRLARQIAPPLARLALVGSVSGVVAGWKGHFPPPAWPELFARWGLPGTAVLAAIAAIALLLGTALVGMGVLARLLSLALIFSLGFEIITVGPTWANGTAVACAVYLMLMGPGLFSLWPLEEPYMKRRAGE